MTDPTRLRPTTKAGRRLLSHYRRPDEGWGKPTDRMMQAVYEMALVLIPQIEAEARAALITPDPAPDVAQDGGLDVETLARAMTEAAPARVGIYAEAEAIAAEYARLRDTPSQPKETK